MICPLCGGTDLKARPSGKAQEWRCLKCSCIFADMEPDAPESVDDPDGEFTKAEFDAAIAAFPVRVRNGIKAGFQEAQETMDQLAADLDAAHARIVELQKDRDELLEKTQIAEAEIARLVVRLSEMTAYQAIEEQPK